MSARKSSSRKRLALAAGLLPALALGACSDYLNHMDGVASSTGDAVQHNKAIHITDPWPRVAANTRTARSGQRVDTATKQFLSGSSQPAPTVNVSSGSDATPASKRDG